MGAVTQSTLVDSPASTTTAWPLRRPTRPLLANSDYERAFNLLECCDSAPALPDFKERIVEALHKHFGIQHVSFFTGATFHNTFVDLAPLTEGLTSRMLPEYQERWARYDVFGAPVAMRHLVTSGVASLTELQNCRTLPAAADAYIRYFLRATWGMQSAVAMRLEMPSGHTALIGMFDPRPDKVGPSDLATLRLVSRQLSVISRRLPTSRAGGVLATLSERQLQVIRLVGDGLSNADIAEILMLAEDSVKKYVSRILSTTGCRSRVELALLARSQ